MHQSKSQNSNSNGGTLLFGVTSARSGADCRHCPERDRLVPPTCRQPASYSHSYAGDHEPSAHDAPRTYIARSWIRLCHGGMEPAASESTAVARRSRELL